MGRASGECSVSEPALSMAVRAWRLYGDYRLSTYSGRTSLQEGTIKMRRRTDEGQGHACDSCILSQVGYTAPGTTRLPFPFSPRQLVPLRKLTLEELARHDGTDPSLPLFLAIKGTVYDITAGKDFYGPDGKCQSSAGPRIFCMLWGPCGGKQLRPWDTVCHRGQCPGPSHGTCLPGVTMRHRLQVALKPTSRKSC